jgi:SAM-dependent methyltransferase
MSQSSPSPLSTAEPWNLVADAYSTEALPVFEKFARDALALAELPPGARIVDVAAGGGALAVQAAEAGHRVFAIDFSSVMLQNLERRAKERGVSDAIERRSGDGQALPYDAGSFDGAFSMFGLMFFPDRAAGFRELARVLRPGRKAVVSSWAPLEGLFGCMMASLQEELPEIPFGKGRGPLSDREEMVGEMKAAGFIDVGVHEIVHTLEAPSVDAWWVSAQRTTAPLVLLRRNLGEDRWTKVGPGILARLKASFPGQPVAFTGRAYLGVGRKP